MNHLRDPDQSALANPSHCKWSSIHKDGCEPLDLLHLLQQLPDPDQELFPQRVAQIRSFHFFPLLPLEIRQLIWQHTFPEDRTDRRFHISLYQVQPDQVRPPAISQVNQESRNEMYHHYQTITMTPITFNSSTGLLEESGLMPKQRFCLNPKHNIISIYWRALFECYANFADHVWIPHLLGHQTKFFGAVPRLVVYCMEGSVEYMIEEIVKALDQKGLSLLSFFLGLEELCFVMSPTKSHKGLAEGVQQLVEFQAGVKTLQASLDSAYAKHLCLKAPLVTRMDELENSVPSGKLWE